MSELRDQHKAFAEWFLQQNPIAPNVEDLAWAAWKAALAQPESRPCTCHPDDNPPQPCAQRYALTECKAQAVGAWAVECDGDLVDVYLTETAAKLIAENMRETNRGRDFAWRVVPLLHTHPPRDEWREAVHDELVTTWTLSAENKDDPRKALQDIINWHVSVSLDPAISSDAQALIERGKAMRDGWRPASEPPEDGRR